jgi:hypothetical protein
LQKQFSTLELNAEIFLDKSNLGWRISQELEGNQMPGESSEEKFCKSVNL